jgi:hypothetical protein
MGSMRNWMLGAAVVVGAMGLAAVPAQAAEFRVHVGGPVAYVPPCPGAGYVWVAGTRRTATGFRDAGTLWDIAGRLCGSATTTMTVAMILTGTLRMSADTSVSAGNRCFAGDLSA